jgi:hypothetical protein
LLLLEILQAFGWLSEAWGADFAGRIDSVATNRYPVGVHDFEISLAYRPDGPLSEPGGHPLLPQHLWL